MKTRIPIKRYVDDPSLTWEERYARLLLHHEAETAFLIATIEALEARLPPTLGDSAHRDEIPWHAGTVEGPQRPLREVRSWRRACTRTAQ